MYMTLYKYAIYLLKVVTGPTQCCPNNCLSSLLRHSEVKSHSEQHLALVHCGVGWGMWWESVIQKTSTSNIVMSVHLTIPPPPPSSKIYTKYLWESAYIRNYYYHHHHHHYCGG
ncbi:Hypothetical predicted protein [Octopus vulgaris]|uniref:Uncharacterized protein n=1 Tax=Octopus vulgaris TaxID=6645 RepID=A0AA36BVF8_OCTVU|nr:Hypothetical predicted protein [Octopus vulgaris]